MSEDAYEVCPIPACRGVYPKKGMILHLRNASKYKNRNYELTDFGLAHLEYLESLPQSKKVRKKRDLEKKILDYKLKVAELVENTVEDVRDDSPFNENIEDYNQ